MFELIDTRPDVNIQEKDYNRLLGYPHDHVLTGRARELAEWAREWYAKYGTPWIYARECSRLEVADGSLRIAGTEFSSENLRAQLAAAGAHETALVAVSAGQECEEHARTLWQDEKPDEYFFLAIYGAAVVEHLIAGAGFRLCSWADGLGLAVLPHYSPGYPGWDIKDQSRLLNLIRNGNTDGVLNDLHVMDTGMLFPKKSLLAVFGITVHVDRVRRLPDLIPCENCSLPSCQYRRAPYRYVLPQLEDVRRLQAPTGQAVPIDRAPLRPVLNADAQYTISRKALRTWSRDRLELRVLHDRSVEARFRYAGTTCSDMGRPLEFDYHVRLGPPEDEYRIRELRCEPAPGDTGHQLMCEYLDDANSLMSAIEREKPLLGRPLSDVLSWERAYDPSGCYCTDASREHKWGLVFEVLHFALANNDLPSDTPRTGGYDQTL
jgi:hypothetical protein